MRCVFFYYFNLFVVIFETFDVSFILLSAIKFFSNEVLQGKLSVTYGTGVSHQLYLHLKVLNIRSD